MTPPDVVELVQRIERGDSTAEAAMVDRFSPGLLYLLRHLTQDTGLAWDLHQETFLLVLQRLRRGELREPEKLPGFLRGVAKNLAYNAFRQRRRKREDGFEDGDALPHTAPPALDLLVHEQEANLARELLQDLPNPRDRDVLLRFCVEEEDRDEICADLGLGHSQFNLVLHRARRRFRQLYEALLAKKSAARDASQ